jgi:tRNA pseudouridine32 synthase / 23S rRNA pseudouridine746 synthase
LNKHSQILEDNEDFVLINKKAGENFHSDDGKMGFFQQLKNDYGDLYPVHRLDKVTSGLLVCAKNLEACRSLNTLFSERKVEKFYLAISDRKPKKKQGWIIGDMEKSRRGTWKLCDSRDNPAVTQFFSTSMGSGERLFLLKPQTGKTHQLRVALKSLGSPICGDPLYYPGLNKSCESRCYLHAYAMRFSLNGKKYTFTNTPTTSGGWFSNDSFTNALEKKYLKPWDLAWPKRK